MRITRDNYNQYFIAYLDGNLPDMDKNEFEKFLILNPDLQKELEGLENVNLYPQKIVFPSKILLRMPDVSIPVNEFNYEDLCIAAAEGDLNQELTDKLDLYLEENKEKQTIFLLVKKLHLNPDLSQKYPNKKGLKKRIYPAGYQIYLSLATAAVFTLLIILFKNNSKINETYTRNNNIEINALVDESFSDNPSVQTEIPPVALNNTKHNQQVKIQQVEIIPLPVYEEVELTQEFAETKSNIFEKKEILKFPEINNTPKEVTIPILTENEVNIPPIEIYDSRSSTFNNNEEIIKEEYLSLSELVIKQLRNNIFKNKENSSKIGIWDLADAGVKGINKLTGSKMKFDRKKNPEAEKIKVSFESKLLSFSTSVDSKE